MVLFAISNVCVLIICCKLPSLRHSQHIANHCLFRTDSLFISIPAIAVLHRPCPPFDTPPFLLLFFYNDSHTSSSRANPIPRQFSVLGLQHLHLFFFKKAPNQSLYRTSPQTFNFSNMFTSPQQSHSSSIPVHTVPSAHHRTPQPSSSVYPPPRYFCAQRSVLSFHNRTAVPVVSVCGSPF